MKIDSIYFKGYSCFKKKWAGFDTIKPINVIIGRNNSGKSHLLDLVESLCGDEPFRNGWQYQLVGVFDEESLKEGFSESRGEGYGNDWDNHGQHFVGKEVTWEVTTSGGKSSRREISNVKYPDDLDITYDLTYERPLPERSLNRRRSGVGTVLHGATHQLNGTSFRRLFADRDIETEQKKVDISLGSDGEGATNIIRRFVATLDDKFPQEVIIRSSWMH